MTRQLHLFRLRRHTVLIALLVTPSFSFRFRIGSVVQGVCGVSARPHLRQASKRAVHERLEPAMPAFSAVTAVPARRSQETANRMEL